MMKLSEIKAKLAEYKSMDGYPFHPMHSVTAEIEYLEEDLADGNYINDEGEDDEN